MKQKNLYRFALALAISGAIVACSKNNSSNNSGDSSSDLQTQSSDQTQVSNENDALITDVNTVLTDQASITGASTNNTRTIIAFGGKPDTLKSPICDASVVLDTTVNPHTLTVTYNGTNCDLTRTRTGTVVISWAAGSKWSDKGATISVSIQNLKITRLSTGKSLTINGTHLYTNTSGGSLVDLYYGDVSSVTHTITSDDMSITFDNGSTRTWHVDRQRTYTYDGGYILTTTGLHTDGATSGISEWGTNRFGNSFETVIEEPLVISQSCSFRLTSGTVSIVRPAVTTTLTFGLDANGESTGCPGDQGTYYFKLVWAGSGGKTYTYILPY